MFSSPNRLHWNVNTARDVPDQNLSKTASALAIQYFFSVAKLYVHVRVDADEFAVVLRLPPLQADDDLLIDAVLCQ
jgi:hypothetical protein